MAKPFVASIIMIVASCTAPQKEVATYQVGQIVTTHGEMLLWLYDETPVHRSSFIELASAGYWDSLSFNRVIEDFVIQGGCPDTPEGFSESPYLLDPEFKEELKHVYGAVGAGRDNNPEKLSAGCQFYIVHDQEGIPRLDGNYTVFGQVFKGLETLEKIATLETDSLDAPLEVVNIDVNIIELTEAQLQENGFEIKQDS